MINKTMALENGVAKISVIENFYILTIYNEGSSDDKTYHPPKEVVVMCKNKMNESGKIVKD